MADKVIALSDEWADFYGENICDPHKIIVLYNGVILPQYKKQDYSDQNVLFLGRLGARKGTYDLLKAVPKVLEAVPDAVFYLGGDGDLKECERIVNEQKLNEHVKILGWVRNEEKEAYLKKCSTFVLPSYSEGMPMSVLEAMSYGLATISTNAGGIPQIIENGVNGIRIDAGDVHALSRSLIELLLHPQDKQIIGTYGRKRIQEKFNVENNIERLCEIYKEIGELK